MKRLLLIVLLASVAAGVSRSDTAAPPLVNYQGLLTDENGGAIPDGMKKLEFNLYDAPLAGNRVWGPQVFDSVPVMGGRFNVILGPVDSAAPPRSIVDAFDGTQNFLAVRVNNGTELAPRQQVLSAPYALIAERVRRLERVVFPEINSRRASIAFESQGTGPHQSNMVFQTEGQGDEGFVYRSQAAGNAPVEIARLDHEGLNVASRISAARIDGGSISGNGVGLASVTRLMYFDRTTSLNSPYWCSDQWVEFLSYQFDVGVNGASILLEPTFTLQAQYHPGCDDCDLESCSYSVRHDLGSLSNTANVLGHVVFSNMSAGHYLGRLQILSRSNECCSDWPSWKPSMKVYVMQ